MSVPFITDPVHVRRMLDCQVNGHYTGKLKDDSKYDNLDFHYINMAFRLAG